MTTIWDALLNRRQMLRLSVTAGIGAPSHESRQTTLHVTTLNADGPGSLKTALEASGPRAVVFDVAGTVEADIAVSSGVLTVMGETNRLCLRGQLRLDNVSNFALRHFRIRPGAGNRHALLMTNCHQGLIDHMSLTWASEDGKLLSIWRNSSDIMVQYSLLAQALLPLSWGILVGKGSTRIALHHNLIAHNRVRNPLMSGDAEGYPGAPLDFDFRNNVVCNWVSHGLRLQPDNLRGNIAFNYFISGPDVQGGGANYPISLATMPGQLALYVGGNYSTPVYGYGAPDDWELVRSPTNQMIDTVYRLALPYLSPDVPTQTASDAYTSVLAGAGAQPWDAADQAIVASVLNRTAGQIASPEEWGGYPAL